MSVRVRHARVLVTLAIVVCALASSPAVEHVAARGGNGRAPA